MHKHVGREQAMRKSWRTIPTRLRLRLLPQNPERSDPHFRVDLWHPLCSLGGRHVRFDPSKPACLGSA